MIGRIGLEDLDRILEIERASYPLPWSPSMFTSEFANPMGIAFGFREEILIGYIFSWILFEDLHINNVAVDPARRRSGIGSELMQACFDAAKLQGAQRASLEVRPSNVTATGLYAKLGFRQISVRKGYYVDTNEDALILAKEL